MTNRTGGARKAAAYSAAVLIGLTTALGSSPVFADDSRVDPAIVEAALASVGALSNDTHAREAAGTEPSAPADLSAEGLSIGDLRMVPVASSGGEETASGAVVFQDTAQSAFAMTSTAQGANAGYSVLFGPAAPTEYRYEFYVGGEPATFGVTEGGGVTVLNSEGDVVNLLAPAWATDANGQHVKTEYVTDGNVLTQVVHHDGATAYPVVADPRLRCDGLWCTVETTRAETAAIADNVLNGSIICAFVPGGYGPTAACASVIVGAWAAANYARSNGFCVGYRVWQANLITGAHLAPILCYA